MKAAHSIAFLLLVIGGLNWLLIGLFNWGVADILGGSVSKIVYILVGLSTLYIIFTHKKTCMMCKKDSMSAPMSSSAPQM